MRTTISLPDPLLDNAKRRASERGVTLSVVVEDALRVHLAEPGVSDACEFRLVTMRGRLTNPALDLDRTSALDVAGDEAWFEGARQ